LITGLNGTGKTRVANELIRSIGIAAKCHFDSELILIDENFLGFANSNFFKKLVTDSNPMLQNQICDLGNNILFSDHFVPFKSIGKIIHTDQKITFENLSSLAFSEKFLLDFTLMLSYRILNKQFENIPVVVDGMLGILNYPDRIVFIKLLKKYIKFSILLETPSTMDFLDYDAKKNKLSSHYKLVLKIPKERYHDKMNEYLEITNTPTEYDLCKIIEF
jgi:uridine kinase